MVPLRFDAERVEFFNNGGVVYEIPKDGHGPFDGFISGDLNGIADAEAHSEVGSGFDDHMFKM